MKPLLPRLATAALAGCALCLAACSQQPARHEASPATSRPAGPAATRHVSRHAAVTPAPLPAQTGIPACDAYLSTYIACHRAAGIFAPGQLQSRYEMMRDSLLRDSLDPDIRPQLANRCASLAGSLHEALHGKSCDAPQPTGADGP
jgi:hypothetical protein